MNEDEVGFADQLAARLRAYGDRPLLEFEGRWYTGDDIDSYVSALRQSLDEAGAAVPQRVGIVTRNRAPHAAAVLGLLAARYPIVMINSYQSAAAIARDIERLRPAVVIADAQDWTAPVLAASAALGCAGISVRVGESAPATVLERQGSGTAAAGPEAAGLHILTSGTTGRPKHVPIPIAALAHTVATMTGGEPAQPDDPPELVYWPFGSIGICQLLAAPFQGKRMVLFERFSVPEWVAAVRKYQVRRAGVQPTILRMILEADVPREDLASLEYLPGGSGPLEPELRAEFEQRYGIPLLWAYGATEFAGSVCAWTPELHRAFGAQKAGSVGRPLPGVQVRILDAAGREVGHGEQGFLTAQVAALGPEWIRTTDLATVDSDGFVTIHGRGDGAINRGGFKILPETVRAVLLGHPAVRDACVVGVHDDRLGQVPFAAVELRQGCPAPTENELRELVREALPSHHVPVAIAVTDRLPRNAALKTQVDEVAAWYRAP